MAYGHTQGGWFPSDATIARRVGVLPSIKLAGQCEGTAPEAAAAEEAKWGGSD
jgi:hypothetical protein